MSVEELDRIAATLPEWEGSPAPARFVAPPADEEPAVPITTHREWLLLILSGSLLAGMVAAWLLDKVMGDRVP